MQPTLDQRSVAEAISALDRLISINQEKLSHACRIIDECRYNEASGESGEIALHFGPAVCDALKGILAAFCAEWKMLIEQQIQHREEMSQVHARLCSGIVIPHPSLKRN